MPPNKAEKLEKPRKINVSKNAITLKGTITATPSPAFDNQKTIYWNTKAGVKLTQNSTEAPLQQPKMSDKQRYFDSKLNSLSPKMTPGIKRLEIEYLAQEKLYKVIKDILQQNFWDKVDKNMC